MVEALLVDSDVYVADDVTDADGDNEGPDDNVDVMHRVVKGDPEPVGEDDLSVDCVSVATRDAVSRAERDEEPVSVMVFVVVIVITADAVKRDVMVDVAAAVSDSVGVSTGDGNAELEDDAVSVEVFVDVGVVDDEVDPMAERLTVTIGDTDGAPDCDESPDADEEIDAEAQLLAKFWVLVWVVEDEESLEGETEADEVKLGDTDINGEDEVVDDIDEDTVSVGDTAPTVADATEVCD